MLLYPEICGSITANTTWTTGGSPYVLTCVVTVEEGSILTIDPEVIVQLETGVDLVVDGVLSASGSQSLPVVFQWDNATQDRWGNIKFNNDIEKSVMSHCIIRGGTNGVDINNSSPEIRDCLITENTRGV